VTATGFLAESEGDRSARRSHQETARFSRASSTSRADPRRFPSHTFCVGTFDLASVSPSVRSVSNSVRRTHPPVSANLRRKPPLIARRVAYDCAPLHVFGNIASVALRKFDMLDAAATLRDLRSPPGNRLEALSGDRAGQHSIRINDKWRICFVWTDHGPENIEIDDYH
jgi:toxin HigB-1